MPYCQPCQSIEAVGFYCSGYVDMHWMSAWVPASPASSQFLQIQPTLAPIKFLAIFVDFADFSTAIPVQLFQHRCSVHLLCRALFGHSMYNKEVI